MTHFDCWTVYRVGQTGFNRVLVCVVFVALCTAWGCIGRAGVLPHKLPGNVPTTPGSTAHSGTFGHGFSAAPDLESYGSAAPSMMALLAAAIRAVSAALNLLVRSSARATAVAAAGEARVSEPTRVLLERDWARHPEVGVTVVVGARRGGRS